MKELVINHIPAVDDSPAQVSVRYRPESGAQTRESQNDFDFSITAEQRRLIQWYLEEYLY